MQFICSGQGRDTTPDPEDLPRRMLADNWVAPAHPNVAVGHKVSRLGFDLSDENSLISAPFILATYSRFHNKLELKADIGKPHNNRRFTLLLCLSCCDAIS